MQWRDSVQPSNDMQGAATAKTHKKIEMQQKPIVRPEPAQSDHPSKKKSKKKTKSKAQNPIPKVASTSTPADANMTKKERNRVARAAALRRDYPTMKNIPHSIRPAQRKQLILQHTQNTGKTVQPTSSAKIKGPGNANPPPTTQSKNSKNDENDKKQRDRATQLKQMYPDMEGIPPKIGKGTKKKLVAQYTERKSALANSVTMPTIPNMTTRSRSHLNELPTIPNMTTRSHSHLNELPTRNGPLPLTLGKIT